MPETMRQLCTGSPQAAEDDLVVPDHEAYIYVRGSNGTTVYRRNRMVGLYMVGPYDCIDNATDLPTNLF